MKFRITPEFYKYLYNNYSHSADEWQGYEEGEIEIIIDGPYITINVINKERGTICQAQSEYSSSEKTIIKLDKIKILEEYNVT